MERSIRGTIRSFESRTSGILFVAGALALAWVPAHAVDNGPTVVGSICMQKVFGAPVTNSNKLNCTANDIRLSRAISASPSTCTRGVPFDLTATFETIVTSNERYDAGFFFRIDAGADARGTGTAATGSCSLSALNPAVSPALNLDGDAAGDLNSGTYQLTFTIPGVACEDTDADGFVNLPNCTSWHSNQGTATDVAAPFSTANALGFKPDTKSKCTCDDTFQVPVTVESATIDVTKDASPVTLPEPGGAITYTVSIKNTATVESVVISSIIDDKFGNIGTSADPNNTCDDLIGDTLAAQQTVNCTFKGDVFGDAGDRHTNIVTGTVTQNGDEISDSDDADVDITDVSDVPTMEKNAQSTTNCSVDATYQVVVVNTSSVDTLTVNSLDDSKFGSLTSVHDNVLSTQCVAGSVIQTDDNYTCTFVGRISSPNTCDFTHNNVVTVEVTDDDGVDTTLTDDANVTSTVTP